jgi:hypothetical protein
VKPCTASVSTATIRSPYLVVDDFLPRETVASIRRGIEMHFETPKAHRPETHQVWNYWFVPGQYTYLRTNPEKVFGREHVETFMSALRQWAAVTLGMNEVTWPYLSLYVNGCRQGVHNDTSNGRFAYVFSVTRNERKSTGGDTIVFREGDLFRKGVNMPSAGSDFCASIEPLFNRLVIFDDRMPHAVDPVEGPMDPLEGRLVLHGHLRSKGLMVEGSLAAQIVEPIVLEMMLGFSAAAIARIKLYSGPLILRFVIEPDGAVATCDVLVDRVIAGDAGDVSWRALAADLVARFRRLRFPAAAGPTTVTQPITF